MKVIEVVHKNHNFRVSIQPSIESARESVGTIALAADAYDFIESDLNVVWILWKSGLDYDESDEILDIFQEYRRATDRLSRLSKLEGPNYLYTISGHEVK